MEQESHGVFKLSFEGEHEANASAQMDPFFVSIEEDTGHPVNGNPRLRYSWTSNAVVEDGGM